MLIGAKCFDLPEGFPAPLAAKAGLHHLVPEAGAGAETSEFHVKYL